MNARSGEVRLITYSDGVPLASGVAASCAAPGISAPVALDDELYIDGGARSPTNADLLVGQDVERALIVSPIPKDTPIMGEAVHHVLGEEIRRLETVGIAAETILPAELERDGFGFDLFDPSKIPTAIEVGCTRGIGEADRLRSLGL